jgi:hypothetical protein
MERLWSLRARPVLMYLDDREYRTQTRGYDHATGEAHKQLRSVARRRATARSRRAACSDSVNVGG